MSHSLAGLVALNLVFLGAGYLLLWAVKGLDSLSELLRLAGAAYLLGLAAVVLAGTELLVAGVAPTVPVVLGVAAALCAAGLLAGRRLGRGRPSLRLGGRASEPFLLAGLAVSALALVLLEAFFRAARVQGLLAYDAWAFWVPKAKAIYFFGGLDKALFLQLAHPRYPILVPTLEAMDFHFMGSVDTTVLHVQFWFLLAGFVLAVAGLLRPQVRLMLIWPFLAVALVMPDLDYRALNPMADATRDYFFVAGALCIGLWLVRAEAWLLVSAGVFLGAAMSTKREGSLLAACLVAAALAVTARRARSAWPRLAAAAAGGFALSVPWLLWVRLHHLPREYESVTWHGMWSHLSRVWPGLRLTTELTFDWNLWLLGAPLGVAAALVLLARRRDALGGLYALTFLLGIAGFTWVFWGVTSFPLDKSDRTGIPRAVGALVLLSLAFAPLMLQRALERRE